MKHLSSQEKTKEACVEWSSKYISVYEEVAKSPIADFTQLGVFSWSDQFIWCSTHCQLNLNIKDEGFHTFQQAQESSFLSVYTLLIQHTFQILESFDISAPKNLRTVEAGVAGSVLIDSNESQSNSHKQGCDRLQIVLHLCDVLQIVLHQFGITNR